MAEGKIKIANRPFARAAAGAFIGMMVGSVFATAFLLNVPFLHNFELSTIDYRLAVTAHSERTSTDILVVGIDERTVQGIETQLGIPWPPPRWFWANLIASLTALEAKAIVLDATFSDLRDAALYRNKDPLAASCESGDETCNVFAEDTLLMSQHAYESGAVVIAVTAPSFEAGEDSDVIRRSVNDHPELRPYIDKALVPVTAAIEPPFLKSDSPESVRHLHFPEGRLLAGVRSVGMADILADDDSRVRRFAPVWRVGEYEVADLAVAAYAVSIASKVTPPAWSFDSPPIPDSRPSLPDIRYLADKIEIGSAWLPMRSDGTSWIRWRGNWTVDEELESRVFEAWPLIRYHDEILLGLDIDPADLDPAVFRDKVVFVGYTMQGEFSDRISTPFGVQPGVYKHASVYDTLKTSERLHSVPEWLDAFLIVVVSMVGGLIVLGLPNTRWQANAGPAVQTALKLIPGVILLLLYGIGLMAAFHFGWILNAVHAGFALALSCLTAAVTAYVYVGREERRRREQVHAMLNRAFSPEVASVALEREERGESVIGGQKYDLTLYFSDIAGFTGISEKLSPEELVRILNEYLTRVTELLDNTHGANVDKYIGDAVMAFWGAPLPSPDGPVHACMAALDAIAVMDEYSKELAAKGLPPLTTRIGINTGPAVAGFIGHPDRPSYTALGDTVNLAARLEGANKAYGSICMVGPETYERAKHAILARELDLVRVKGKKIPVRVYELIGRAEDPLPDRREIKRRYEAALARYRSRDFQGALEAFESLAADHADAASTALAEWCRKRLDDPPPEDWDGSNILTEK